MKTPGLYVPLDVNYVSDEGIRRAGAAAELLYIRGLAYSKRTQSDGYLPDYDLAVISVGLPQVPDAVKALVERELWLVVDGGWQIRSWRRWNDMHGDSADKRKRAADRQRRSRERKAAEAAAEAAKGSADEAESNDGSNASGSAAAPDEAAEDADPAADVTHLVTRDVTRTSRVTSRARHTDKEKRREETTEEKKDFRGGCDTSRAIAVRSVDSPPAGADAQHHDDDADPVDVTAQTLVREWIDALPKTPPRSVIGQTARILKQLLDEGIHPDDIRAGLAPWARKGLHPSTLPSEVNAVMNANVIRMPTGHTLAATGTDATVAAWAALSQQLSPENR